MSMGSWATRSRTLRMVLVTAITSAASLVFAAVPQAATAAPGDSFLAPGAIAGCYISQIPTGATTTALQRLSFNYQNNTATLTTSGSSNDIYNSIGYNPIDGYLYGTELRNGVNYLIKIGQNGVVVNNAVLVLPNADPGQTTMYGFFSGTIDSTGTMYITGVGVQQYLAINLNTLTYSVRNLSVRPVGNGDWTIVGGVLYTANRNGDILAYNPTTGAQIPALSKVGALPAATGSPSFYGAGFTLQNGQVVFDDNASGNSYMYNPTTQTAKLVATVPPTGQNDGTCIPSSPSITLSKTGPTQYQAGVPVTYTFTAVNTGNVPLSNVNITDPTFSGSGTAPVPGNCVVVATGTTSPSTPATDGSATVDIGQSMICTATYTPTQADVAAGKITNTGQVVGTDATSFIQQNVTAQSSWSMQGVSISLAKTASTNTLVAGQTITYTFTATNNGAVPLNNVTVTEGSFSGTGTLSAPGNCAVNGSPATNGSATLQPGQALVCTAAYVVTQADVDAGQLTNAATDTGVSSTGLNVTGSSQVTIPSNQTPAIQVVKAASPTSVTTPSTPVTYTFTITNTGNVTLSNVNVTDAFTQGGTGTMSAITCQSLSSPAAVCSGSTTVLAPGQVATFTATYAPTQADIDAGGMKNTATAAGSPPAGAPVTSTSSATVTAPANPALTVVKGVSKVTDVNGDGVTDAGDQIFYTFLVTNTGNVTMSNIAINDPLLSANSITVSCPSSTLAPSSTETCVATAGYVITQADVDAGGVSNTATAQGTPPGSTTPVPSPPSSTNTPTTTKPGISLTKTPSTTTMVAGQTITYTLVATNTGDVTLNNTSISEGSFNGSGSLSALSCNPAQPATLAPGAKLTCTATYTPTQTDVNAGSITNTATVSGTPPGSTTPVTAAASATVTSAQAVSCSSLYGLDWTANPHTIWQVDPTTGANVPVTTISNTGLLNGLAVDQSTNTFWFTSQANNQSTVTIYTVDALAGTQTTFTVTAPTASGILAGAFDPANGLYYFGGTNGGLFALYAFNTVTKTFVGQVASMGWGSNSTVNNLSDIAFDSAGHMYFTTDSTSNNSPSRLWVTQMPVPSTPGTGNLLANLISTSPANQATSGGLAFGSDGYLYLSQTVPGTIQQIDPTTGVVVATRTLTTAAHFGDIASCASPNVIQAQKNLPSGRVNTGDQFTVTITGNGVQSTGNQGTTTGTATGVQNQSPSEVAGPVVGLAGLVYAVTETAAGTTNLAAYVSTWNCVNTATGTSIASGPGTSGSFTMPNTGAAGATIMCTFTNVPAAPAISLVKTASTQTPTLGQTVAYTLVATNTGNVPLANASIAEGAFSGSGVLSALSCNPAQPTTLAVGAQLTCSATYVVTQADVDAGKVTNSATATGTPPAGSAVTSTATATINPTQSPSLSMVKGVSKVTDVNGNGITDAGDQIFYKFAVTNTGNVTMSGIAVNDPLLAANGITVTCPSSSLAPGASEVCTADSGYVITQADVDAGGVSNTATAQGTPPGSTTPVVSPPSSTSTPTTNQPQITLVKTADTTTLVAGHTITYTLVATNTGDVTLTNASIAEGSFNGSGSLSALSCNPTQPATLTPGAKVTCAATYVVTQADVDAGTLTNTATAQGTPPGSSTPVVSPPASVTITQPTGPALSLVKGVSKVSDVNGNGITDAGDQIFYTFKVSNAGNVTMSNIAVNDPLLSANSITVSCPSPTLAPGASETCMATTGYGITQADVDAGSVSNTATATGTPPGSTTPVSSPPSSTNTPTTNQASIHLTKTPSTNTLVLGQTITYTLVATNTGDVTLTNASISEGSFSGSGSLSALSCNPAQPATLAPGATLTCTATYVVTQADIDAGSITNTATAQGTPPSGPPVTSTATATIPGSPTQPGISLTKTPSTNTLVAGQTITYTLVATNTGDVTLTNASIAEGSFSGSGTLSALSCNPVQPATLAPGAKLTCTATYVVTQADVDAGKITNSASATGTPPSGPPVTATATAVVPGTQSPSLALVKGVSKVTDVNGNGITDAGDQIFYTFDVTNTGNVTVSNVGVSDPLLAANSITVTCPSSSLAPGASEVCTADSGYVITQSDVDAGGVSNTATVNGTPPGSTTPVVSPPSSTSTPTTNQPQITLVKTADTTTLVAGHTITYTLVATNTGDVTLSNASINEGAFTGSGSLSPLSCNPTAPATLAPGAKLTCTATYVVTQADVDAGSLTNTATAQGTPPGSTTPVVSPPATVTITQPASPSLSVVKSVSKVTDVNGNGITDAGDQIFYAFNVTNTGNVTMSSITVNDPMLAANSITVSCPSSSLAPGVSEVCTAATGYVITQADVDAGDVSNTATAKGTPPGSTTPVPSPPSSTSTPTTAQPGVSLTKTPSSSTFVAGQTVTYTLVATNTGDVTLSSVSISEGAFTGSGSLSALSCNPAQPTTLAPGAKLTCTATYVATQADVDAGAVTNHASVSGNPPTGAPVTDTAQATIASTPAPALSVVKGVSKVTDVNGNGITDAGDQILYKFTVTNSGNVTMSNIAVNDPLLAANSITVTCPSSSLTPGASEVCTADSGYVITQSDVDAGGVSNTATAQGTPPGSTTPVPSPPSSTNTPTTNQPQITLVKTADTTTLVAGQTITYTMVATNTGDVTLSGVSIAEGSFTGSGSLSALTCNPAQPATLAPGGKLTCAATYVVTQADVDAGTLTNTATAQGTPPGSSTPVVSPPSTVTITQSASPAISVVKSVSKITDVNGNGITDAGDQILYSFAVTNTGNVTLSGIAVNDPLLTNTGIAVSCPSSTLAPGAVETCTSTSGYVITQADADAGGVTNSATSQGTPPGSTTPVVSPPSTAVTPTTNQPAISLVKTADKTTLVAGQTITYTLVATNTGDVTLSNVAISEGAFTGSGAMSALTCNPTQPATLAPGAKLTCTATYVVTQADVDAGTIVNHASTAGTPPTGAPVSATAQASVPSDPSPSLALVKRVSRVVDVNHNGITDAGDQIFYAFKVTNTSNVTMSNIKVSDPLLTAHKVAVSCPMTTLAPGASETCAATSGYRITQADVDAGGVANKATAQGTPPGSSTPVTSPPSSTHTPTSYRPGLTLLKRFGHGVDVNHDGYVDTGDQLWWTFLVTNTGDVTVHGLQIHDPVLAAQHVAVICHPSTLKPGQSVLCVQVQPYFVTAADQARGYVKNVAIGSAFGPGGSVIGTNQSTVVTPVDGPPGTSLPNTGGPTMTAWLAAFVSLSGGLVLMCLGRRRRTE